MKPPVESPNTQPKATAASGAVKQSPVIEPPTEPFINLSGDGPVDPTKFQRFIIPMEFIQKANSVELPGLDPDDLRDTGEQSPMNPSNPPAHLLPDTRTEAHAPVAPPPATTARPPDKSDVPTLRELQATTKMVAHRPPGPFARWALTGKAPKEAKVALAVIVALVCVLILSFIHLKAGGPAAMPGAATAVSQTTAATPGTTDPIGASAKVETTSSVPTNPKLDTSSDNGNEVHSSGAAVSNTVSPGRVDQPKHPLVPKTATASQRIERTLPVGHPEVTPAAPSVPLPATSGPSPVASSQPSNGFWKHSQ